MNEERRSSIRLPALGELPGRLLDETGRELSCVAIDVSMHGMCLETSEPLQPCTTVILTVGEHAIPFRVVRCRRGAGRPAYRIGLAVEDRAEDVRVVFAKERRQSKMRLDSSVLNSVAYGADRGQKGRRSWPKDGFSSGSRKPGP